MITICVCDDDIEISYIVDNYCKQYFKDNMYNLIYFSNGNDLLHEKRVIDLLFLDIGLPVKSGIEIAQKIRSKNIHIPIVFLTSYTDKMQIGYKVRAFRFLIKPLTYEDFYETLNDFKSEFIDSAKIIIRQKDRQTVLIQNNIMFIESLGDISAIHIEKETILVDKTLKQWCCELNSDYFIQCHKSYIVNLKFVHSINNNIILENGNEIEISRRKKKEFNEAFLNYIRICSM